MLCTPFTDEETEPQRNGFSKLLSLAICFGGQNLLLLFQDFYCLSSSITGEPINLVLASISIILGSKANQHLFTLAIFIKNLLCVLNLVLGTGKNIGP